MFSEKGRDMDHKITKFNADEHYGVAIYDDTKLLVINPFDVEGGTVINQNVTSTKDATVKNPIRVKLWHLIRRQNNATV